MKSMLRGMFRGAIALPREHVATTWDEFEVEDYDGLLDGDDSIHHEALKHTVSAELLNKHLAESPDGN